MLAVYLFDKYLSKFDDYNFEKYWENKIVKRSRLYLIGAVIYFLVAITIITEIILIGNGSLFVAIMVFGLTFIIYGIYYLRAILKFIGKHNTRYLQIKMGYRNEGFSKDNVVG